MGTAKQLIPALVEAEPLTWDRSYSKNMKPVRGYPNYWKITDEVSYIDGPVTQGGNYSDDIYIWEAEIIRDDNFDVTDTFKITNLQEFLTSDSEVVNGDTVYKYYYNSGVEDFEYQHTDVIDNISLEFDQVGRRLVAFESAGDVNFLWFDPQPSAQVVTNFGAGRTPKIVSDTYYRQGGTADSERFLFYIKESNQEIVYRRQTERYQTEYSLGNTDDAVEIMTISKNIYGGLTVMYCVDDGSGGLVTQSLTARHAPDTVALGTEKEYTDTILLESSYSQTKFSTKEALVKPEILNEGIVLGLSYVGDLFEVRDNKITLSGISDSFNVGSSYSENLFEVKESLIQTEAQTNGLSVGTSYTQTSFFTQEALIKPEVLTEEISVGLSYTENTVSVG